MGEVVLLLCGGVVAWFADVTRRPYVDCRHCEGKKKDYDADEEHFRLTACWHCVNTGMRLRWELRLVSVFW